MQGACACLAHVGNRSESVLFPYSLQACLRGSSACHPLHMQGNEDLVLVVVSLVAVDDVSFHRSICFKGFLGPASCASFSSRVQSVLCTPLAWAHTFVLVLVLVGTLVIMG